MSIFKLIKFIILSILLSELLLFLISFIIKDHSKSKTNNEASSIAILGESTSSENYGGIQSYSSILQHKLDKNFHQKFKIINLARPGIDSATVVERLKHYLSENQPPQLVIAMMGINDQFYYSDFMDSEHLYRIEKILLYSRLYKFIRIFSYNMRNLFSNEHDSANNSRQKSKITKWFFESKDLNAKELFLKDIINNLIHDKNKSQMNLNDFYDALRLLYEIYKTKKQGELILPILFQSLNENKNSYFIMSLLAGVYYDLKKYKESDEWLEKSKKMSQKDILKITIQSYRELILLAEIFNFKLAIMQYPLLDITPLKRIIGHSSKIVFIENKFNFLHKLQDHQYDDIFTDRFAGVFGHCTQTGNEMIAEEIMHHLFNDGENIPAKNPPSQ